METEAFSSEIKSKYSPEAITAATDQIRVLVEKPGFGRKPLGDEFLTEKNLRRYEQEHEEELLDPLRRWAFGKVERKSVEEALGCKVVVSGEGKERKVDFELKPAEEQENVTPLFELLVKCEQRTLHWQKQLQGANSSNKTIFETDLEEEDKLRQSLLKLAGARINDLFVAGGVRSGALKTVLAETGVKAVEGVVAAALICGVTNYLGARPRMEEAQAILSAPEKSQAIWKMIENLLPELKIDIIALQLAIGDHIPEAGEILAGRAQLKTIDLGYFLGEITDLNKLIAMGPERAAQLMQEAQLIEKIGALGGIIGGALSMTELFRSRLGSLKI